MPTLKGLSPCQPVTQHARASFYLTPQNAATSALNTATAAATSAASTAASYTGLGGHSHAEEHAADAGKLPEGATAGDVKKMDAEGLAVFEDRDVRHEVLVKINQLAL